MIFGEYGMKQSVYYIIAGFLILNISDVSNATLKMRGHSSAVRVSSGATFVVDQAVGSLSGRLIKESGATISGQDITFVDGVLVDVGNDVLLNAVLDSSNQLIMGGNDTLRAQPGKVLQSLLVSGSGNRLEGQPLFNSAIALQNGSAELTLAIQSALNQNVSLGGGTILLDDTLQFEDGKMFTGHGSVDVQGNELVLGGKDLVVTSSIAWSNAGHITLNSTLDFSGTFSFSGTDNRIIGNGNILDLSSGGVIVIENDAKLYLVDVVIKGVDNNSFLFLNGNAELCLSNVTIELNGNVTTTLGTVCVQGPTTILLKNYNWTFDTSGYLIVDGITLWRDTVDQLTQGDILFGTPEENFVTFTNGGMIKNIGQDSTAALESAIDILQTSTASLQTQLMNYIEQPSLQSRIATISLVFNITAKNGKN